MWHASIQAGTLISLMLYTLNLAMCFAFLANVYGEFMQVCHDSLSALMIVSMYVIGCWSFSTHFRTS